MEPGTLSKMMTTKVSQNIIRKLANRVTFQNFPVHQCTRNNWITSRNFSNPLHLKMQGVLLKRLSRHGMTRTNRSLGKHPSGLSEPIELSTKTTRLSYHLPEFLRQVPTDLTKLTIPVPMDYVISNTIKQSKHTVIDLLRA